MKDRDAVAYYERRAAEEAAAAEQAHDERAAKSHREPGDHYRDLAGGDGRQASDDPRPADKGTLPKDLQIVP